jgi:hypothetical protein
VEEVGEAWTRRRRRSGQRRSVVSMEVPGCGGEGRADDVVPQRFDVEEERGADVEAHTEDAEDGARWRWTRSRSRHRWVCGGKMKGLGFRCSGTLKKKKNSDEYDDIINVCCYI